MPEDVGAIRSAVSGEESGAWAESRGSGRAWEDAGGSDACSSVARGPTAAELLAAVEAAIDDLEAGEVQDARARLRLLAEAIRPHVTSRTDKAFGPT